MLPFVPLKALFQKQADSFHARLSHRQRRLELCQLSFLGCLPLRRALRAAAGGRGQGQVPRPASARRQRRQLCRCRRVLLRRLVFQALHGAVWGQQAATSNGCTAHWLPSCAAPGLSRQCVCPTPAAAAAHLKLRLQLVVVDKVGSRAHRPRT